MLKKGGTQYASASAGVDDGVQIHFALQCANRVKDRQLATLVLRAKEAFVTHGEIRRPVAVKIRKRGYGISKCDARDRGAREDKASSR